LTNVVLWSENWFLEESWTSMRKCMSELVSTFRKSRTDPLDCC
jgi:hypothetical protein